MSTYTASTASKAVFGPSAEALARRVLIIDDDPMLCLLLDEMLTQMGNGVCGSASSEAVALELAARLKPDLLIVDAWLGEDNGIETAGKILASGYIPHLFMSGNIQKLRQLRPDAVTLEKPFKEPALALAIQSALRHHALPNDRL
jgi:CheY-like chemotaxis protein